MSALDLSRSAAILLNLRVYEENIQPPVTTHFASVSLKRLVMGQPVLRARYIGG